MTVQHHGQQDVPQSGLLVVEVLVCLWCVLSQGVEGP